MCLFRQSHKKEKVYLNFTEMFILLNGVHYCFVAISLLFFFGSSFSHIFMDFRQSIASNK